MSRTRSIHPKISTNETWIGLSPNARVLLLALGTFSDYSDRFSLDPVAMESHAPGLWGDGIFAELVRAGAVVVDGGMATILFAFGFSRRHVSKWEALRSAVFERDGYVCQYCGSDDFLHCDHVVPQSRGGADTMENLTTACRHCNLSKGDRLLSEWRS